MIVSREFAKHLSEDEKKNILDNISKIREWLEKNAVSLIEPTTIHLDLTYDLKVFPTGEVYVRNNRERIYWDKGDVPSYEHQRKLKVHLVSEDLSCCLTLIEKWENIKSELLMKIGIQKKSLIGIQKLASTELEF